MLKTIHGASLAAAMFLMVAPTMAAAHNYTYYDQNGRAHYTHSAKYAQRHDHAPPRSCRHEATKGTVIGGVGGAVVGQVIAKNTLGTLIGAGAGAVAGHEIAKSHCERR